MLSARQKSRYIIQVYKAMHAYQKINNIKGECIQNCQYLYDCITKNGLCDFIKPKVVITVYQTDDGPAIFIVHMVLQDADGNLIDPSYEVASLKRDYHTSVKGFINSLKNCKGLLDQKDVIKSTISQFLSLIPFEERIMDNNGPILTNKLTYNLQADWVEENVDAHFKVKR